MEKKEEEQDTDVIEDHIKKPEIESYQNEWNKKEDSPMGNGVSLVASEQSGTNKTEKEGQKNSQP